jgi:hypothetical protein
VDTGAKVPATKDDSSAISTMAHKLSLEDLVEECSALQVSSTTDLITTLAERISKLEHQMLSHIQGIAPGLQESISNHDRQLETLISSLEATTTRN